MGLSSLFEIGRSGIVASQVGIQVAGQNIANAATPGHTRQTVQLTGRAPARSDAFGVGRGVDVSAVMRNIDRAVEMRLREGSGRESDARVRAEVTDQLEAVINELTDNDLSDQLADFFNSWSEAGNLTGSAAAVVESGDRLGQRLQLLRADLGSLRRQIEDSLDAAVAQVNQKLEEIASLNVEVALAESTSANANSLRDRRDVLIGELSALVDVSVYENSTAGHLDVLIGSTPVVLGTDARPLEIVRTAADGRSTASIRVAGDGEPIEPTSGEIAGLLGSRDDDVDAMIDTVETLAATLIHEVNRIHSTATNEPRQTRSEAVLQIAADDRGRSFNDPLNATFAALPFPPRNGSLVVQVRDPAGAVTEHLIEIDLDGLDASLAPGFADDTSAEDLAAALAGIPGLGATIGGDGRLSVTADPGGYEFSFVEDTSGVLPALGLNAFFEGTGATDIAVRESLREAPSGLALGRIEGGRFVENGAALAVADLREAPAASLGGVSILDRWNEAVQGSGAAASRSRIAFDSASTVRQSLESQRAAVSGVSLDEEAVQLLTYQKQFQGSARVIALADELLNQLAQVV